MFLKEDDIDKFVLNNEEVKECEKIYISSDVLLTTEENEILKSNNIEVFIIPDYYFEDEIKEVQ